MEHKGYHIIKIPKGVVGNFSKIEEEFLELKDAISQGAKIMELVELSDLYGAIEIYINEKHNLTMKDLQIMSDITRRVFKHGYR